MILKYLEFKLDMNKMLTLYLMLIKMYFYNLIIIFYNFHYVHLYFVYLLYKIYLTNHNAKNIAFKTTILLLSGVN